MSEEQFERDILRHAAMDRRSFIKKAILGAAFAVPVIASFDMLTSPMAGAQCTSSNQTSGTSGTGTTGGAGGSRPRRRSTAETACGGEPDGGTGGTSTFSDNITSDRDLKADVTPVAW